MRSAAPALHVLLTTNLPHTQLVELKRAAAVGAGTTGATGAAAARMAGEAASEQSSEESGGQTGRGARGVAHGAVVSLVDIDDEGCCD
jgi:hypothetical protein